MRYKKITSDEERVEIKKSLTGNFCDERSRELFLEGRSIVGHFGWQYFICIECRKNKIGLPLPFYGLLKRDGTIIINFELGYISHFHGEYLLINRYSSELNKRCFGIVKFDGTLVCPIEYDYIGKVSEGVFAIGKENKIGFMDLTWNIVIPLNYQRKIGIDYEFHDGYACVRYVEKFGFIDHYNNRLTPFEFDEYSEFQNGKAIVNKTSRDWGCINYETYELDLEGEMVLLNCDRENVERDMSIYGGDDILDAYEGDASNMWNTD